MFLLSSYQARCDHFYYHAAMNNSGSFSSGGNRGSGTATAGRGGAGVTSRSNSSGIETGRSSGKSFASFGKGSPLETGKAPSLSIDKAGVITQKNSFTTPEKSRSTSSVTTQNREKTRMFGPKLEVTKGVSPDTRNPHVSAFKETTHIYKSNADAKYHADPAHTKLHTEHNHQQKPLEKFRNTGDHTVKPQEHVLFSRTKEVKASPPQSDSNRPQESLRRMESLYTRPEAAVSKTNNKKTDTNKAEPKIKTQSDLLLRTTRELHAGEKDSLQKKTMTTYNRTRPSVTSGKDRIAISEKGDMRILKAKVEKAATQTVTKDRKTKAIDEMAEPKVTSPLPTSSERQVFQQAVEKAVNQPATSSIKLEQQIQTSVLLKSEKIATSEVPKTSAKIQAEKPYSFESTKKPIQVITHAETEYLVQTYEKQFLSEHGASIAGQMTETMQSHPEIQADIEQAARVMAAYKAIGSDTSFRPEEAERIVLKALDQKFEKTHLKEQIVTEAFATEIAQPQVEPETTTNIIREAHPATQIETSLTTLPVLTEVQTSEQLAALQTLPRIELRTYPEVSVQTQQANSGNSGTVQLRNSLAADEPEPPITPEEITVEEELEEEVQPVQIPDIIYERDTVQDTLRYKLVMELAEQAFEATQGAPVDGDVFLNGLSPVYEDLKSVILPEDQPDDYLTDILETLAEYKFERVDEVSSAIQHLIALKPAIQLGEIPTVTEEDVRRVRDSFRYPKTLIKEALW